MTGGLDRILGRIRGTTDNKKRPPPEDKRYTRAVGTLRKTKYDPFTTDIGDNISDLELLDMHIPRQELVMHSPKTYKPFTPAEAQKFRVLSAAQERGGGPNLDRHLYANPMQNLDYRVYETITRHTFAGALSDAFVKFIMGKGFKPELELINPDKDNEASNADEISSNSEIIERLMEIDRQMTADDVSFSIKVASMIMSTVVYNRGALVFVYDKPVKVGDKSYSEIPSTLVYAHARDLGMIETDAKTDALTGVQWIRDTNQFVKKKDMIYLWNPISSSKVHNSWYYGTSLLQPMFGSAKLIRKLIAEDFPAMAENAWAGLFFIVARNEGSTPEDKMREFEDLNQNLTPGRPGILVKDPDDVNVHSVDLRPRISDFQMLMESMIKLCISIIGLPQVGFYDESASNRDTMAGKIQLTMQTNIEPIREWLSEMLVNQWYGRWFKLLYKDEPEILEKFKIKLSWSNLSIAEWFDNIETLLALDQRKPLKDSEFGELAHLDNYENLIDPEAAEEAEMLRKQQLAEGNMGGAGMGGGGGGAGQMTPYPSQTSGQNRPFDRSRSTKPVGRQRQSPI